MKNTKRIVVWGVLVAALSAFTILACRGIIPDRTAAIAVRGVMLFALTLCFLELCSSLLSNEKVACLTASSSIEIYLIMTCIIRMVISNSILTWRAIVATVIICAATDSTAFLVGKLFGRHHPRCLARISPGKTIEGFLGGYLGGAYAAFFIAVPFILQETNPGFYFALLCPLAAIIGDLAASAIKRYCGLKDFNEVTLQIPILKWLERPLQSHGGYLDRFDSIIWGLALFCLLSV